MPVSSIGSALVASAQKVASGGGSQANSIAAAAQEATETRATTIKEAQHGDPVAKRKLAKLEASQQQPEASTTKTSEAGKGALVDHAA